MTAQLTKLFIMQQEPLAAAQELCERLLVRAESVRIGVCQAGVQYRHFFAWLLRTIRCLNDVNPAAATEAAAIKVDPSNVAAFLHGQFCTDMVAPELKVRCDECFRGEICMCRDHQPALCVKRLPMHLTAEQLHGIFSALQCV